MFKKRSLIKGLLIAGSLGLAALGSTGAMAQAQKLK